MISSVEKPRGKKWGKPQQNSSSLTAVVVQLTSGPSMVATFAL
jgi:hypothetical protein